MNCNRSPRPAKRREKEPEPTSRAAKRQRLEPPARPIPPEVLLLHLPSLIVYPRGHALHHRSLLLSLEALRRCLGLPGLEPGVECRAWTGTAEMASMLGLVDVAEKAITKGLVLAQKHPSLRHYYARLILLSARIAPSPRHAQQTLKRFLASPQLSRLPMHMAYTAHLDLIASFSSLRSASASLPPADCTRALAAIDVLQSLARQQAHSQVVYLATLLRVQVLINAGSWSKVPDALPPPPPQPTKDKTDSSQPTPPYPSLAEEMHPVIKVHLLILMVIFYTYKGTSDLVALALKDLHILLDSGTALPPSSPGTDVDIDAAPGSSSAAAARAGVIEVYPGVWIQSTHPRVLYLLGFLISSVAKRDPVGRKPKKRVFAKEGLAVYEREKDREARGAGHLTAGWSAVARVEDEGTELRMERIKADLLSELVGIAVMRCEFEEAERVLNELIAHTRSIPVPPSVHYCGHAAAPQKAGDHNSKLNLEENELSVHYTLFRDYSARITLHQAHLAHARGQVQMAEACYRVATRLSSGSEDADADADHRMGTKDKRKEKDPWVYACSRAGEISLRFGVLAEREVDKSREARKAWEAMMPSSSGPSSDFDAVLASSEGGEPTVGGVEKEEGDYGGAASEEDEDELCQEALDVADECDRLGGALCAVGEVLRSCATKEYLKGKNHLRQALSISTGAQDNHLRALVLALVAARYMYTAKEHAEGMLKVCETLGAGMGAAPIPPPVSANNAGGSQSSQAQESQASSTQKKGPDNVGNARLRLWVGERFLELHRWAGDSTKASRQRKVNNKLRSALERQRATAQSQ
ncbi:hypothetical protein AX16_005841 [Volvariella volvacea WC 439]|nr:hypothetical protein AX16_005841 [Volvariella volvacea WC 439]